MKDNTSNVYHTVIIQYYDWSSNINSIMILIYSCPFPIQTENSRCQ
jgi:hypothetical protein